MDSARTQAALCYFETPPLAQQQVACRHTDILKQHLGVTVRRVVEPVDCQGPDDGDSGCLQRYKNHRLLTVAFGLPIGLTHEDQNLAARVHRAGYPPLASVNNIGVAVLIDRRLNIGRIGRCDARFCHCKRGTDFTFEKRLQPGFFLLVGAVANQHFHISGIGRRTIEYLGGDQRATHDLRQRGIFEIAQARTVLAVRQEQVPKTFLSRFLFQVFHDRRYGPACFATVQELEVFGLCRIDMALHEVIKLRSKPFHLGRIVEIHKCETCKN